MSLALPAFASANAGGEAPACHDEPELSRAAAELLLSHNWSSSQAVSSAVRAAGSDVVLVRGYHYVLDSAGPDAFLAEFERGADAPIVCGFAQGAEERLLLVAARAGSLRPLTTRSRRVRGELASGFSAPELVVADARGEAKRWSVESDALAQGVPVPEGLARPARVQLLARGPKGLRPIAERVLPGKSSVGTDGPAAAAQPPGTPHAPRTAPSAPVDPAEQATPADATVRAADARRSDPATRLEDPKPAPPPAQRAGGTTPADQAEPSDREARGDGPSRGDRAAHSGGAVQADQRAPSDRDARGSEPSRGDRAVQADQREPAEPGARGDSSSSVAQAARVEPPPSGKAAAPGGSNQSETVAQPDAQAARDEVASRLTRLRGANARRALRANDLLDRVATEQASAVCASGQVGHEPSPGQDPEARLLQAGVRARRVGETVARAETTAAAFAAFERSPAHRLSLLEPGFTDAGYGQALDSRGRTCVVILLAAWPRFVGR